MSDECSTAVTAAQASLRDAKRTIGDEMDRNSMLDLAPYSGSVVSVDVPAGSGRGAIRDSHQVSHTVSGAPDDVTLATRRAGRPS